MDLTTANFDSQITQSTTPTVVDFWATWCGPCRAMGPMIEELSNEMTEVTFAKVNVDEAQELAMRFNVLSIPTFVVMKGGSEVGRFSGAMSKDAFKERVKQIIG